MESANDEVNARIYDACQFDDSVDAGVRTADDNDQPIGRVDSQRQLAQFKRAGLIGDESEQMNVGRDVRVLVHEPEISAGPGRTKPHDLRWRTAVVPLRGRESEVLAIESARQVRAIHAETFLRRID